jgi:hypothetical protein
MILAGFILLPIADFQLPIAKAPQKTFQSEIGNLQSSMTSVAHHELRTFIILVADFVDWLAFALTHIKSIWAVDYDSIDIADVLIRMNDPLRNQNGSGIVLSHDDCLHCAKSFRIGAVVPHPQFEGRWAKKTKEISLIDVLMRSASNSGKS